jgi:hypothetical protein
MLTKRLFRRFFIGKDDPFGENAKGVDLQRKNVTTDRETGPLLGYDPPYLGFLRWPL